MEWKIIFIFEAKLGLSPISHLTSNLDHVELTQANEDIIIIKYIVENIYYLSDNIS